MKVPAYLKATRHVVEIEIDEDVTDIVDIMDADAALCGIVRVAGYVCKDGDKYETPFDETEIVGSRLLLVVIERDGRTREYQLDAPELTLVLRQRCCNPIFRVPCTRLDALMSVAHEAAVDGDLFWDCLVEQAERDEYHQQRRDE
jgi:hypothetical protein